MKRKVLTIQLAPFYIAFKEGVFLTDDITSDIFAVLVGQTVARLMERTI